MTTTAYFTYTWRHVHATPAGQATDPGDMKVRYFEDTDTALIGFTEREVVETREIAEDVYADLDENGDLVSLTIEHARKKANLPEVAYETGS
ncbi:MAG: DUF2283 domain-containing protein [Gemmatimonadota bacterium]